MFASREGHGCPQCPCLCIAEDLSIRNLCCLDYTLLSSLFLNRKCFTYISMTSLRIVHNPSASVQCLSRRLGGRHEAVHGTPHSPVPVLPPKKNSVDSRPKFTTVQFLHRLQLSLPPCRHFEPSHQLKSSSKRNSAGRSYCDTYNADG